MRFVIHKIYLNVRQTHIEKEEDEKWLGDYDRQYVHSKLQNYVLKSLFPIYREATTSSLRRNR